MSIFGGSLEKIVVRGLGPVLDPLLEPVIGPHLDETEVRRREVEIPLHEAELGVLAVQQGLRAGDDELRRFGAAMVASALTKVEDPSRGVVPPDVSDGVSGMAASLPLGDVTDNPYISPDEAERVAAVIAESSSDPGPAIV